MANEFFTALPGVEQPAFAGVLDTDPSGLSLQSHVPASVPNEVSLSSDPHFLSAPASAGPTVAVPINIPVQSGPPAIPSTLTGSIPAATSIPAPGPLPNRRACY